MPRLKSSNLVYAAVLLALVGVWPDSLAQTDQGTLLKGASVTEKNLVEALVPEPPAAIDSATGPAVLTRGIRPSLRQSVGEETIKAKKVPSASLLITFDTNSTALTTQSKLELDMVAKALGNEKLKAFTFEIEGHADARGTPEANRALSQQRADVARDYLIKTHGIAESRLRATGKGDVAPLNTKDIAAAENRRVALTTVVP